MVTLTSDFDPVTTSHILQYVDRRTRMFRGYSNEASLQFCYEIPSGSVHVTYSKDPEGDEIEISFERKRPKLRLVGGEKKDDGPRPLRLPAYAHRDP